MSSKRINVDFDFYLGCPSPHWLQQTKTKLFISFARLKHTVKLKQSMGEWALDSGAFSDVSKLGRFSVSSEEYADRVQCLADRIGNMQFACIQDWMCEPYILSTTGLSVEQHQRRTVDSFLQLREYAPLINWLPTIQGWQEQDYISHIRMYHTSGINLKSFDLVGIGSVCRRQKTNDAIKIVRTIANLGIKLHGFGVKKLGIILGAAKTLRSADSMAWSLHARKRSALPGCEHANCSSCLRYAERWAAEIHDSTRNLIDLGSNDLFYDQT